VPLVEKGNRLYVLFEVRSEDLKHQPGEIGFPGGMMEQGETSEECAIRETCEELCLPMHAIEVLGELNYIVAYANFTLYAFLGVLDEKSLSAVSPNADEVKETFLVPLDFFLEQEPELYNNRIMQDVAPDFPIEKVAPSGKYNWKSKTSLVVIYTYFDSETNCERIIWGLTARILYDFVEMIKQN
ncbi:MAG: CoA pyrophosphatase, partial [Clostridiales Family XIII bacterium]|jgi:8-oxo-dGTP pyrophosphatase MutT (NUDIX family)|nr:CoA pyrophosphatase [Clostridiales Family XIII bacterium]